MRIEITSAKVQTISGTNERGDWAMRIQQGYLHTPGEKYPERFEFILNRDQQPYAPGMYKLGREALSIDRRGRLEVRPHFVPEVTAEPARQAASA